MASRLPNDPYAAIRKSADRRNHDPFPWAKLVFFLISAGGFGWCYYHYIWLFRLPQERVLVDRSGKQIHARIMEKDGDLLKLTLIPDGTSQYFPTSLLSSDDQEFCRSLPRKAALDFPLPYTLKNPDGSTQAVTLKGYNSYFVDYATATNPADNYIPMSSLSEFDRAIVQTLPASLSLSFPLDYNLSDGADGTVAAHIFGRSSNMIRYTTIADGKTYNRLISTLTPLEQAMVVSINPNVSDQYPVQVTLITKKDEKQPVDLWNKTDRYIEYTNPAEKNDHFVHLYPVNELTAECQQTITQLETQKSIPTPYVCAVTDLHGRTLVTKILARSSDMVKFFVEAGNKTYIYPISNLASMDQTFINSLPKNLTDSWDLPELTTTVQNARTQLIAIDEKITSLENQLSRPEINGSGDPIFESRERALLQQKITDYKVQSGHYITEITNDFKQRIADLETQNVALEGKTRSADLANSEKIAVQNQILKNTDTINALKDELKATIEVGKAVKLPVL